MLWPNVGIFALVKGLEDAACGAAKAEEEGSKGPCAGCEAGSGDYMGQQRRQVDAGKGKGARRGGAVQ